MGKTTRRALMGFAAGALQGVSDFYRTKAMEDAIEKREARLAAIRAQERGEDRSFQRELSAEQRQAQAERDKQMAAAQAERDAAQGAQRMEELQFGAKAQREQSAAQIAAQERIASMPARTAPGMVTLEVPDGQGGTLLRTVRGDDPELAAGIPGARLASQGAQYMNAETRAAEAAGSATSTVGGRRGPADGDACVMPDGRRGRMKGGVCTI